MLDLFVDIETCPVFPQIVRAAQRHALELYVVTRDYLPADANVHLILAEEDEDTAQRWIAANISRGDICVTQDAILASDCRRRGALALTPTGKAWSGHDANATGPRSVSLAYAPLNPRADGGARVFAQRLEWVIAAALADSRRPVLPGSRLVRAAPAVARPWPSRIAVGH
jgi:uncharacterized protein YaiI (UPF0178 family)